MFFSIVRLSYNRKDLKLIEGKFIEQKASTPNEFFNGLVKAYYNYIKTEKDNLAKGE